MTNVTVNYTPRRPRHVLHGVLTFITFGMWLPVWIGTVIYAAAYNRGQERRLGIETQPTLSPNTKKVLLGVGAAYLAVVGFSLASGDGTLLADEPEREVVGTTETSENRGVAAAREWRENREAEARQRVNEAREARGLDPLPERRTPPPISSQPKADTAGLTGTAAGIYQSANRVSYALGDSVKMILTGEHPTTCADYRYMVNNAKTLTGEPGEHLRAALRWSPIADDC